VSPALLEGLPALTVTGSPVGSWGFHGQFDATCGIVGHCPQGRSGSSSPEKRTLRLSSPSGATAVMGHREEEQRYQGLSSRPTPLFTIAADY
jgi:hypothetical protein